MFGSTILDVAIGLVMAFLSISLIGTAIREFIEAMLKTRAMDLERGLRELLHDKSGDKLAARIFNHPLIKGLFGGTYDPARLKQAAGVFGGAGPGLSMPVAARRALPSYIPSGQFAAALMDLVMQEAASARSAAGQQPLTFDNLKAAAAKMENEEVRRAVMSALDFADKDIEKVRANLESWFNGTMERVSGWYKRRTQFILFAIGLGVAALLNVDALTIAFHLQTDEALRRALVSSGTLTVGAGAPEGGKSFADLRSEFDQLGLPIGWSAGLIPVPQSDRVCPLEVECRLQFAWWKAFPMLLGWVITAFAVTLGASFWFDLLNKVVTLRGTVKPEAEKT